MVDNILHLTLKKKWFNLIRSGEKTEEYREIKKYWIDRLLEEQSHPKEFNYIIFKNGYKEDAPTMKVEWKGMVVDYCEHYKDLVFVIKLGKVIESL